MKLGSATRTVEVSVFRRRFGGCLEAGTADLQLWIGNQGSGSLALVSPLRGFGWQMEEFVGYRVAWAAFGGSDRS